MADMNLPCQAWSLSQLFHLKQNTGQIEQQNNLPANHVVMKQFLTCQDYVAVIEYSLHSKAFGAMDSRERRKPENSTIL